MPELINEFSWSPSRHRMFEMCRRQYYYYYYGSWGGWKNTSDEQTRLLYHLKKMTTLPQLVGTVVHEAIHRALKAHQTGRDVTQAAAMGYAAQLFKRHLEDSRAGRWRQSASRYANLFEHYYNRPVDEDAAQAQIADSLSAFFASACYPLLRDVPPDAWLSVEALQSFVFNDTKLWVSLDAAVRCNGGVAVYDWKTGREREADKLQLSVYALYASSTWGVAPSDLRLQDVYLQSGAVRTVVVDADTLEETRCTIVESIASMRNALDDPNANAASIDPFPMTDNRALCRSCPFQAVCYSGDALPEKPLEKPALPAPAPKDPVQLSLF